MAAYQSRPAEPAQRHGRGEPAALRRAPPVGGWCRPSMTPLAPPARPCGRPSSVWLCAAGSSLLEFDCGSFSRSPRLPAGPHAGSRTGVVAGALRVSPIGRGRHFLSGTGGGGGGSSVALPQCLLRRHPLLAAAVCRVLHSRQHVHLPGSGRHRAAAGRARGRGAARGGAARQGRAVHVLRPARGRDRDRGV